MSGIDRCELESAITSEMRNLKASEKRLSQQFKQLHEASMDRRFDFLKSVWELERKASLIEQLMLTLEE